MKTTKEFPATHSMSTDWFVADKDGNIAIFSFDDNGPVPVDIPAQNASEIMTSEEDFGEKDSDSINYFELTDEQVEELMTNAVKPEPFNIQGDHDLFVQVDESNKKEFIDVFANYIDFCFSHKHGIYYLETILGYDESESYQKHAKETFLKTVKRVVHIYADEYWEIEHYGNNEKWKLPFYCYKQSDSSSSELAQRINVPKFPFKEEQISEKQRQKLVRVPLKFSECTGFQIAQYVICHWYSDYYDIEKNKRTYSKFITTEGDFKYFLKEQDKNIDGETPIIIEDIGIDKRNKNA